MSLTGPGRADAVRLDEFRKGRRIQELVFDVASELTKLFRDQRGCEIPAHALFPQLAGIVGRYVERRVNVLAPADRKDLFLAPYYGWLVEALLQNLKGDVDNGEQHEYIPDFAAKLKSVEERYLLLETKGYDPLKDIKKAAAERWCAAVNAPGGFGKWIYRVIDRPEKVSDVSSTFTRTDT